MTTTTEQERNAALVHWMYSHDEWKRFVRWKKMRKSVLHYMLFSIWPAFKSKSPDVTITHKQVSVDGIGQFFHDGNYELRLVNIRDAGEMNILEITYENINSRLPDLRDIYVPVPKGKLREAIELQEYLLYRYQPNK
jgi:hypothetical protein